MRRNAKVDVNQNEIVKQLRKIPRMTVAHTHMVGSGFPDIVVGYCGINFLFEIKTDSKKKLTPFEDSFMDKWNGQYYVVTDAIGVFGEISRYIKGANRKNLIGYVKVFWDVQL